MKKTGILNAELMKQIASLGHKELFLIGDAGMPIPKGVEVIDLVLCEGVPTFEQVLNAVLKETEVEYYYLADEIQTDNRRLFDYIRGAMPAHPYETMPHSDLKHLTQSCKFAVRTGECSSYSNVVLRAGVTF
jgi:D-ribose pyranase